MRWLMIIILATCLAAGGCDVVDPATAPLSNDVSDTAGGPTVPPSTDVPAVRVDTTDTAEANPGEDATGDVAPEDDGPAPDSAPDTMDAETAVTPLDGGPDDAPEDGGDTVDVTTTPSDAGNVDGPTPDDTIDDDGMDSAVETGPCMTCVGAEAPVYSLVDFQPQSPGFETSYGLEAFLGKVTLVGLLASWCGYCKLQATMLEEMSLELELEGAAVNLVIVNMIAAEPTQQGFIDVVSFPLLQDVADVDAWGLHQGVKDDLYIYGPTGGLITFLPHDGETNTNMSTDEGYQNVLQAILDAVKSTSAL